MIPPINRPPADGAIRCITRNPGTRDLKPETGNRKPETRNLKSKAENFPSSNCPTADGAMRCVSRNLILEIRNPTREREFFIENLLVRIHFIIVMIGWTGLAPWEFESLSPGSLLSTFLHYPKFDTRNSKPDHILEFEGFVRSDVRTSRDQICTALGP